MTRRVCVICVMFVAGMSAAPIRAMAQDDADPSVSGLGAMVKAVKPTAAVIAPVPPPPPIVATKGDVQIDGLYFQLQSSFFNGRLSFTNHFYFFFPDGHLFYGVPPGGIVKPNPTNDDFVALQKFDAKNCGTYLVKGDKVTFQFADGKPQPHGFAFEKPGNKNVVMLDGLGAIKMGRFKDNQTLDGLYEAGATTRYSSTGSGTPDSFIGTSNSLDFHPDGTFGKAAVSSFDIQGRTSQTSGGGTSAGGGKYKISGNTLTLIHSDGKTESVTVFPYPETDEFPPAHIGVNGSLYKLEKR